MCNLRSRGLDTLARCDAPRTSGKPESDSDVQAQGLAQVAADELGLRITQWVCACASEYLGGLVFVLVFDVFVLLVDVFVLQNIFVRLCFCMCLLCLC